MTEKKLYEKLEKRNNREAKRRHLVMEKQEREAMTRLAEAQKITLTGIGTTMREIRAAAQAAAENRAVRKVIITNVPTAAAIRRTLPNQEDVVIVICKAVQTGTAYVVTDEDLRKQLLEVIGEREADNADDN